MFRKLGLCGVFAASVLLAAPAVAQEWTWGSMAIVSDTLGANANRLCVGAAASRRPGDLGCPSFAPYVTSAGNVGIGTSAPAGKLDVSGTLGNVYIDSTGSVLAMTRPSINYFGATGANSLLYLLTANTPRIVVNSNGNVGISTTNPNAKLEVNGLVSSTGLSVTGIVTATYFEGNGSRLTGLSVAAATDRIVSGTTNIIANTNGAISFTTAGTERMVVTSAGNVGIGTTSPQATLQVSGSFIVSTSAQTTTPSLYVGADGYVGIGTTNPVVKLHVDGDFAIASSTSAGAGQGGRLIFSGNRTAYVWLDDQLDGQSPTQADLYFGLNSAGKAFNFGFGSTKAAFTNWMTINSGNVGIGTTAPQATLQVSGSFIVSTTGQNTTPTLYVGTNGYVGIGTSSPATLLQLYSNSPRLQFTDTDTGSDSRINPDSGAGAIYIEADFNNEVANSVVGFRVDGSDKMLINSSGNLGIGTTSPNAKLDVAGTISATGISVTGIVSATYFEGNGSRLTGLSVAAATDRIVSGTSSVVVNENAGISFTTAGTARMAIDRNGNVALGTSVFNARLAVVTPQSALNQMAVGYDNTYQLLFGAGSGNAQIQAVRQGVTYNHPLSLQPLAGKVGIGTTAPQATLEVSGTIRIATTDVETCADGSAVGTIRINPATGAVEMCRK